jgi:hypothetical protein
VWHPWPERPRRRVADGIDAGWRLALSLGLVKFWILSVVYLSLVEGAHGWAIAAAICGLPFPVAHVFAWMTLIAWLDERAWLRAQRMAREAGVVGDRGRTGQ